jgi:hypothetical protein
MSLGGDAKTLALQTLDPAECDAPSEQRPAQRTGEVRRILSRVRVMPDRLPRGWDGHAQVVQERPPLVGKPVSAVSASRIGSSAGRFEMAPRDHRAHQLDPERPRDVVVADPRLAPGTDLLRPGGGHKAPPAIASGDEGVPRQAKGRLEAFQGVR